MSFDGKGKLGKSEIAEDIQFFAKCLKYGAIAVGGVGFAAGAFMLVSAGCKNIQNWEEANMTEHGGPKSSTMKNYKGDSIPQASKDKLNNLILKID